jgi:hypothetical protein
MGIFQQQLLIVLIFLPADVAGMIVAQKDVPFLTRLPEPADLAGPAVHDTRFLGDSAKRVGASIKRVVQDLHHRVIGRRFPDQLVDFDVAQDHRHLNVGCAQPQKDLSGTAQLAELGKHEPNQPRDVFIGINLDLADFTPAKARRKHEAVFTALRLGIASGNAALAQQAQLIL